MRIALGFLAGLLFGLGLILGGMTNPAKVLNFLDIAGAWDPSLAFVMGGATVTAFLGYRLIWRRPSPLLDDAYDTPSSNVVDAPLLTGAALFGIGWGTGGFCPGPAWTSLSMASSGILVFLPAMLLGIILGNRSKSLQIFRMKGA